MTRTRFLTIACALLVAPACGGGGGSTSTGSGTGVTGTGSGGPTGTNGASSGGATGTNSGTSGTTGGIPGSGPGGSASGGSSSGTTTGPAAPDFALSPSLNALTLPIGGQETIEIDIQRDAGGTLDTDTLLFATLTDAGVTAVPNPLQTAGGATALTLQVADSVPAGSYPVTVFASSQSNPQSSHFTSVALTVSDQTVTTLLIDNDDSQNNADGGGLPSPSDAFYTQLLQSAGILYNTYVIPSTGDEFDDNVVANYSTVLWYTGANNLMTGDGCLSSPDEYFLQSWLDQGGNTLLMFSPFLVQDLDPNHLWGFTPSNQFLSLYVGAEGDDQNPQQLFDGQSFVASGVDGTAFGASDGGEDGGESFDVVPHPIADTAAAINPGDGGTLPLVTVPADELGTSEPQPLPTAVIKTGAGQAGTSTVVYVGIPLEDIQASDAGSANAFFGAILESLPASP